MTRLRFCIRSIALSLGLFGDLAMVHAAVPQLLNHQGRIAVRGVNFEGDGQFKFSLVNANGSLTYWSNDGSAAAGAEPTLGVTLAVTKGLYSVVLGDSLLTNMSAVPSSVFENEDVRLRVWFNDGSHGYQLITPDQRLAAAPYALAADKATSFAGSLAGDVTGTQGATSISAATVTGKALTGYSSTTGSISSTDTILTAINKLNGNDALKATLASPNFTGTVSGVTASMVGLGNVTNTSDASKPVSTAQQTALDLKANLASPTFTGTVSGVTASMVGLGNVTNTSDANKPVSTAQQTALNLKANLASPTFTGTVSGVTASMVGLGNVTNTSDANKPVSTAQQTALNLKANLASPSFSGTVSLPAGTALVAPLKLATGINLSSAVFGSVEFDGTNLYLTNNSANPSRKTIAFTDTAIASGAVGSSQLASELTLGGTTTGTFSGPLTGNVTGNVTGSAATFTGSLAGDVTGTQSATAISAATVTGKALTGYVSGAGTIDATDTILGAINKLNGNVGLKAPTASPAFTGIPSAPTALAATNTTQLATTEFVQSAIQNVVGAAPAALDTLSELATALNNDQSYASTITTALSLKAPLASPTFTGTVSGITATMVGLGNVTNTSDASKPVSTAQQSALDLKAPLASPTFSGTVSGITATMVGLGNVTNTSDASKPVSTAQQAALDLKSNLASPSFTGTVTLPTGTTTVAPLKLATGANLTTAVFGSVEFDGTNLYLTNNAATPTRKTVAFTDSALATGVVGSSQLASGLTLGGTTTGTFSGPLTGNVTGNASGSAASFTGSLSGEVTGTQGSTVISNAAVIGKVLTGYVSGSGAVSASDTILGAINKLNGNDALKAPLASPTFTGTVSGITASMVGLGNVTNTSDASKPVSTAQQTALDLKSNLASPTFTGTVTSPAFSGPLTGNVTGNVSGTAASFTGSLVGDVTGTQAATVISAATVTGKALTGYASGSGTVSSSDTILSAINKLNGNDALKATLASPTFTGTVVLPTGTSSVAPLKLATGVNLTTAVFGSVEFDGTNLYLTNNSGTPTRKTIAFTDSALATGAVGSSQLASGLTLGGMTTGTFSGPLTGNVTGNVSGSAASFTGSLSGDVTGTQAATAISAATVTGKALTGYVSGAGSVSSSDTILTAINKLNGNDTLKATLASPTFTGTVSGITATMVGLGNVTNTSDASKPVSTAQQTALDLKANVASPNFSGTVTLSAGTTSVAPLKLARGANLSSAVFGSVEFDGTNLYLTNNSATPTRKTVAFTDSALATGVVGSSQLASDLTLGGTTTGTFSGNVTGNVTGSAASFTGSLAGDVTGTQSATAISAATVTGKALTGYVSAAGTITATDTILAAINKLNGNDGLKANLASPTFTGTVTSPAFSGPLIGNVTGNVNGSAASFTGSLAGDVTGTQGATAISNTTVTGKALTGYVSGAGTITATDTILAAINKLNGNNGLKANLASPTFTGTVSGITATMVGLGNVTNTSDASKPVSTAQQTALDLKANLASPTFTGTVSGITASMVGLGNVTNTSDANKPVSTAQQTALDLKANLASPAFSGTVALPAGTSSAAPLKLATGTSLTTAVFGSVEFDGTNLYLTNNSASPTRKTLAFTDSVISSVPLASLTAAPLKPVVAWGNNHDGQTTLPTLANVAAVAAGDSHSLVLLDDGTVTAWGLNTSGQTTIPSSLTGVTEIAASASHNLVRKSDGTMVAWGDNSYGQNTIPSGITTATKVAAGEKHSLALLANGTVRAWGDNGFGQTTLPSGLTGATITAIAAGYDHCLALKSDGTVISWGRDDAGQVTLPSGLTNVVAIAAGAYHSLALKSDGTVVAWGWDGGGQVTVPASLSGVSKIAGGYAFSMALKTDGTLVLWGDNTDGETIIPSTATQVTHIAAGATHALALRADAISAQVARLDQDNVFTGKIGIKRTPATNSLEVEGTASKTTAGSWLANSDRRIKTEIQSITGALEKLDQVRLVDFRYTDEYRAAHPSIEDVRYPNVIAQEFAKVFPDDVKNSGEVMPDGSPILQVDTYPLTIYAAAAVQELHRENRQLQRENQELRREIEASKKRDAQQEQRLLKLEAILSN